jgi:hypothetical protein
MKNIISEIMKFFSVVSVFATAAIMLSEKYQDLALVMLPVLVVGFTVGSVCRVNEFLKCKV